MIEEVSLKKLLYYYPWIFLGIVISFILIFSAYQIFYPIFIPEPGKTIYIPPKTNLKIIADNLEKEGIVRSSFFLRFYLALTNQNTKVKAGNYTFYGNLNTIKVAEILVKGGRGIIITFPEGLTMVEIEDILKKNGLNVEFKKYRLKDFPETELLKYFPAEANLEGFLAPDTYEFFKEESEREIILKFLNNFENKFLGEFLKYPGVNFYEKLILASILEKEGKYYEDMKIIAGILENRLKIEKKLEVDATIAYPRCQKYPCDWKVTSKDLKIDSPYNTYLNKGYPPTPISNPGLNAIKAALEPIKTDYLYYITTDDGKAIFAKTLKEHQQNIKKYLKK
jgi:UPF0755 protein